MKKLSCLYFLLLLSLWAADFWQTKPFTAWSDKDVQKMLTGSPWARQVGVATGTSSISDTETAARGGRGSGRGIQQGGFGDATLGAPGIADRDGRGAGASPEAIPSMSVLIRWQTALPMKQAIARAKYGSEVTTSPEAKKFVEREEPNYVISVAGLPETVAGGDLEKLKSAVQGRTALATKGKDPVQPANIEFSTHDAMMDAYFVFPKATIFTLDDKEVEFSTRIGNLSFRYRFRLKDMVFNGKLEL